MFTPPASGFAHYGRAITSRMQIREGFASPGTLEATFLHCARVQRKVAKQLGELPARDPDEYRDLTAPAPAMSDFIQLARPGCQGQPMLGIVQLRRSGGSNGLLQRQPLSWQLRAKS